LKKLSTLECCLSHSEDSFRRKKFRSCDLFNLFYLRTYNLLTFCPDGTDETIGTGDFLCFSREEVDTLESYRKVLYPCLS
jgi:hypothetical protein